MKLNISSVATLVLFPGRTCATSCNRTGQLYEIQAENVDVKIEEVCGWLWDALGAYMTCPASYAYCGGIEETHILGWRFIVPPECNTGIVESAWWMATENFWGAIECP